jgi:hypothetical protein
VLPLTGIACSSTECLGIHIGNPQTANLGDGNGNVAQLMELRQEESAIFGTCVESLIGGNHLRMYRQNGAVHPTGALFLACVAYFSCFVKFPYRITLRVSEEEVVLSFSRTIYKIFICGFQDAVENHTISPNGYDVGR